MKNISTHVWEGLVAEVKLALLSCLSIRPVDASDCLYNWNAPGFLLCGMETDMVPAFYKVVKVR
ncbi:MAG: hypothetical protein IKP58_01170 [Victivallales bacterium]|nr:hypothetical protein [Victivallales bacterium]